MGGGLHRQTTLQDDIHRKISNFHVDIFHSPRRKEKILPKFHLIPPKFHLILPKFYFSPTWGFFIPHVDI